MGSMNYKDHFKFWLQNNVVVYEPEDDLDNNNNGDDVGILQPPPPPALDYPNNEVPANTDDVSNNIINEIYEERQIVGISLDNLFDRLGNNSDGVSQDDINSLINVINDGNIQQINLQINEMNSNLAPEDDIAQVPPLNSDELRQAIENFENNI